MRKIRIARGRPENKTITVTIKRLCCANREEGTAKTPT